ncbi:SDR family oxidoreductase [Citreicella sp. C3M06]|uniref:SDR family NAD(P)-dependent oxidoreductase n=1 Tax=Citreicella sp. C3M06 TaxID=2841564 RepID=UPI001C087A3E|nr:SDR family oxidoreductase [Citreicella sp. C3M06]MBU2962602.1 SDR family oxidoreductase [Citreicella sp. C3M06]
MPRVVLVTGGARGIGHAIAAEFARDHAVAITWATTVPKGLPDKTLAIRADLLAQSAAEAIVSQVLNRFGALDVIVNNAGQIGMSPAQDFDAAALQDMLGVNLLAPQALLAAALPHLKPGAAIVNISSVNAVLPPYGASIYGASKAALNLWTRAMAKELGPQGIRVNAVAPGAIDTPESPRSDDLKGLFVKDTALGRIGQPQDVARAVRFLASEEAGFITGEILTVSGGYRL